MSRKFFCLSLFFLLNTISAQIASATTMAIITIQLYDTSGSAITGGNPIDPTGPNTWTITQGTSFRVRLFGQIIDPELTNTSREGTAFDNQPLGIQHVSGDLLTSGVNIVNPLRNNSFSPPRWFNFGKLPSAPFIGFQTNLLDGDSDSDLDPLGTGLSNQSLALDDPTGDSGIDNAALAAVQLGATGSAAGLVQGWYSADNLGSTLLTFDPSFINVFTELASNGGFGAKGLITNFSSDYVSIPITINVVPEPSAIFAGVLGIAGLCYCQRRGRRS